MITENEKRVYKILKDLDIQYGKYEHEPVYTIEEIDQLDIHFNGQNCKNLFIRNGKGDRHYLIIVVDTKRVNLKILARELNSTRLSFASERRLFKYLGLRPGAVNPFGIINDNEKAVEVLVDKDLKDCDSICFHPNTNTATVTISNKDFEKFLNWCGNKFSYIEI